MEAKTYSEAIDFIAKQIAATTLMPSIFHEMYDNEAEGMIKAVSFIYEVAPSQVRGDANAVAIEIIESE